jgi:hypothetical protein
VGGGKPLGEPPADAVEGAGGDAWSMPEDVAARASIDPPIVVPIPLP